MKILVNFADEIKIIWYSIKKINIMENNEKNKCGKHFESACSSYGISTDEFLNYTRT